MRMFKDSVPHADCVPSERVNGNASPAETQVSLVVAKAIHGWLTTYEFPWTVQYCLA